MQITYKTSTELDESKHYLYPAGAVLGFIIIVAIVIVFFIPILLFLLVYVIEPYFYKLFTKRNFILVSILILCVNLFYIKEIYVISISIIVYLLSIIQSK